ncbi:MAG: hypothetical protein R3279_01725 [Putridiphycobacter sp.]|nr:hypothetical protein [Putridiphycobacter sp.]
MMRVLLVSFFTVISLLASAQLDVVVLKNGSEIRGIVIEKSDESIKLKSKDGSIWVFKNTEVLEVKSFKPLVSNTGYYGTLSFGALGGSDLSGNISIVNGYKFNKHWGLALGLGYEGFYGRQYMPAFIEGKFNILDKGSTPFLTAGFGYDVPFSITDNNKGGFFGQALLGFQHQLGEHFGIVTGIGFRYGQLQVENWGWWGPIDGSAKTIYEINRFDLRFGFIFR